MWKRLGRVLLLPPMALLIPLVPVSAALLVASMVLLGTESVVSYAAYALSAYTLTVLCVRIPTLLKCFRRFREENRYIRRWREDTRLRVNVSLYSALAYNVLYGVFQLALGCYHGTFWFGSIGAYYILLALMRFFLVRHSQKYAPGERMREELKKYRACGWMFLFMNLALALIVFFMLYFNRSFEHHMITAIAMAAYTFTAFTIAALNVVRYKRYRSPVFSASMAISLAAACVSMLTLSSTMLTTFRDGTVNELGEKVMLGCIGVAVSGAVVVMALCMIIRGTRELKLLKKQGELSDGKQLK